MMMMIVIQLRPVVGSIIQRSPVTIIQQGGSKANHQTFSNDEVDEAEASLWQMLQWIQHWSSII